MVFCVIMKESIIQAKIIRYLEKDLGCYIVKVIKATKSGIPDLLLSYRGNFIGIEVKTPTTMGNTSPLQRVNIDLIHKSGGVAFVACSVEDVKEQFALLQV